MSNSGSGFRVLDSCMKIEVDSFLDHIALAIHIRTKAVFSSPSTSVARFLFSLSLQCTKNLNSHLTCKDRSARSLVRLCELVSRIYAVV